MELICNVLWSLSVVSKTKTFEKLRLERYLGRDRFGGMGFVHDMRNKRSIYNAIPLVGLILGGRIYILTAPTLIYLKHFPVYMQLS